MLPIAVELGEQIRERTSEPPAEEVLPIPGLGEQALDLPAELLVVSAERVEAPRADRDPVARARVWDLVEQPVEDPLDALPGRFGCGRGRHGENLPEPGRKTRPFHCRGEVAVFPAPFR
jgi:hypothetical protein